MYTCLLDGTTYLVPDKYLEKVRARLAGQAELAVLGDLTAFKGAQILDLLVDDDRFTSNFITDGLDFIVDSYRFPLLVRYPDPEDWSFSDLLGGKRLPYRVRNLAEGLYRPVRPQRFRVVVCGLGDVGGTLVTGLRLLGGETISEICLYDRNDSKLQRWYREASQILNPDGSAMPPIRIIDKTELFSGDVFIFCVSAGIPPVGSEGGKDVRMIQLEQNARILGEYVDLAGEADYGGQFFIVSDPVDQLCMASFRSGRLKSQQIRGFGLGVMYARAVFHAREKKLPLENLRVYGPHGNGLAVLNDLTAYDPAISAELTELTRTENLTIRAAGFKPYVAPALSSGALSILACLRGGWHYSSTMMDGVWFGSRNRCVNGYNEYEGLVLDPAFIQLLDTTRTGLAASMEQLS